MEKVLISALVVAGFACGPMGEPKQAWEHRPPAAESSASSEPYVAPTAEPAKDPTHEDVCRKMWTLIADDAGAKAKKNPKAKVPTDKDRSDFLQDCYKTGKDESKANPEKYNCQKKCIIDAAVLGDVETCGKACK